MRLKESFWTWLADVTMPGLLIPSLLVAWGTAYWLELPFNAALFVSIPVVALVMTVGIVLWSNRRSRQKAKEDSSGFGRDSGA